MSQGSDSAKAGVRHVFDGIEELDNRLPNWWLGILWGTVLFAFGYWFYYQSAGLGPGQLEAYQAERAAAEEVAKARAPKTPEEGGGAVAISAADPAQVAQGYEVFKQNCASCHGAEGQGLVGPNLTDNYWIHGASPEQIRAVIAQGKLDKGMPGWEPVLGAERVSKVTAWVLSVKGKNLPGKAPQGELVE